MIPITRPAETVLPTRAVKYLQQRQAKANLNAARSTRIQKDWKNFLRTVARQDVEHQLNISFSGKCAYCEYDTARDIEHYYPKSLYPDRMFRWDNFLKGCKDCNQFKQDQFPLDAQQNPLLLDPCHHEPLDYFVWDRSTGHIRARPEDPYELHARQTIEVLQLNYGNRPHARQRKYHLIHSLLKLA